MASPSITYTFSNSTTADASQVNTNFTDLINGMIDGTKDFSINALTLAGALTANGHVTLGNATSDDVTVTGSLASSIPVKTTATYNVGSSTLGLLSIYFGRNSQSVRLAGSASMAATYTFTLPVNVGTAGYALVDSDAAGTTAWQNISEPDFGQNLSIAASVSGNALTVSLKDAGGSDASSSSPIRIAFRSATSATGTYVLRTVTAALSVTVSSGSTLGHVSGSQFPIYVYALDNAGTVELAVSTTQYSTAGVRTTTAEGGAGAADSATGLYSTTARSNVAMRLLGQILITEATAGTWSSSPTQISLGKFFQENWLPYTPTGAFTNTTYRGKYRKNGPNLDIMFDADCTGTPGAGSFTVSVPSNHTIDTGSFAYASSTVPTIGTASILDHATRGYPGVVYYETGSGTIRIYCAETTGASTSEVTNANPIGFGTSDNITGIFSIPITEFL